MGRNAILAAQPSLSLSLSCDPRAGRDKGSRRSESRDWRSHDWRSRDLGHVTATKPPPSRHAPWGDPMPSVTFWVT
jgi:hypothetical protein